MPTENNKNSFFIRILCFIIHSIGINYQSLYIIDIFFIKKHIQILIYLSLLILLILIIYDIIQLIIEELPEFDKKIYIYIGILNIIFYIIISKQIKNKVYYENIITCSLYIIPIVYQFYKVMFIEI